jgi:IMP cyclohydrolase
MPIEWKDWKAPAYPGRIIAIGQESAGDALLVVYMMTGRSPASQARRLVEDGDGSLHTEITDPDALLQGNPQLLLYDCVLRFQDHLLISNGMQTSLLEMAAASLAQAQMPLSPLAILIRAHAQPYWVEGTQRGHFLDLTEYEPDAPHYTPRISAALDHKEAAFSLIRRHEGKTARAFFTLPHQRGRLHLISTYDGLLTEKDAPLAPFRGDPLQLTLPNDNPTNLLNAFRDAFAPRPASNDLDLRISIAVQRFHPHERTLHTFLWNRHDNPA